MEHRLSQRLPVGKSLLVYKRGLPIATGRLRDVSKRGMFMVTDFAEVGLHQKLEVEFRVPEKDRDVPRRIAAVVVRKTDEGLAMEFEHDSESEVDNPGIQALLDAQSGSVDRTFRDVFAV
ncbi:PilZ domain-containing protein [Marinobacter salicampi]|uniref:PilZ domain-containing protein n=1 Tax=Marinobacter salicampi TaxID=435907 RepID=UPI00140C8209|nr:PilZ domain-containing protein [Marinobacter salicampi]